MPASVFRDGPTLPPDVPCPKSIGECPHWTGTHCQHGIEWPATNPDGTAKGSRGALWCVLGVLFLAVIAVLVIVVASAPSTP